MWDKARIIDTRLVIVNCQWTYYSHDGEKKNLLQFSLIAQPWQCKLVTQGKKKKKKIKLSFRRGKGSTNKGISSCER